jgi:CheY-like chemotaxis protein
MVAQSQNEFGTSPRVLIVDDEPMVRDLIAAQLAADGNIADGVGSGEEALALLDREPFDLVIL